MADNKKVNWDDISTWPVEAVNRLEELLQIQKYDNFPIRAPYARSNPLIGRGGYIGPNVEIPQIPFLEDYGMLMLQSPNAFEGDSRSIINLKQMQENKKKVHYYAHGGDVDETGLAHLEEDEYVLPPDTADAIGRDKLDSLLAATHDYGLSPAMGRRIGGSTEEPIPQPEPVPIAPQQSRLQVQQPTQRQVEDSYFPTFQEYLEANEKADPIGTDPVKVYNDYVEKLIPEDMRRRRHTRREIKAMQEEFKKDVPPPAPKEKQKEEQGILSKIGTAASQAFEDIGRKFEAAQAGGLKDKEAAVELAKKQLGTEPIQDREAFAKEWEKRGGLTSPWQIAKLIKEEPVGALLAGIQNLIGFAPLIGGTVAGALGGPTGAALGGAAAVGTEQYGAEVINYVVSEAKKAGIDLSDANATKQWLDSGGLPDLRTEGIAPAVTNALFTALTLRLSAFYMGAVGKGATEEAIAAAQKRISPLKSAGTAATGFTVAPLAAEKAAGRDVTLQQFVDTAALNGIFVALGVPAGLKYAAKVERQGLRRLDIEKKMDEVLNKEPTPIDDEASLDAIATARAEAEGKATTAEPKTIKIDTIPEVKEGEEIYTQEVTPKGTIDEQLQRNEIQKQEDAYVQERNRLPRYSDAELAELFVMYGEGQDPFAGTPYDKLSRIKELYDSGALTHPEELRIVLEDALDEAAAVNIVLETAKVEQNANLEKADQTLAQEAKKRTPRKRKSPLERGVPPVEEQPPTGASAATEVPPVQQGTGGEVADQFGLGTRAGVGEESTGAGSAGLPRSGEPLADTSRPDTAATERPVVPGRDVAGEEGVGTGSGEVVEPDLTAQLEASLRGEKAPPVSPLKKHISDGTAIRWIMKKLNLTSDADKRDITATFKKDPLGWKKLIEAELAKKPTDEAEALFNPLRDVEEKPLREVTRKLVEAGDTPKLLDYLIERTTSPLTRTILQLLKKAGIKVDYEILDKIVSLDDRPVLARASMRNDGSGKIVLDRRRADEDTLIHELVHVGTLKAYRRPITKQQREAVAEINRLYEQAKKHFHVDEPGMLNAEEFIAEGYAAPRVQRVLRNVEYQGKNLWERVKQAFLKLLGMPQTLYSRLEKVAPKIVEGPRAETAEQARETAAASTGIPQTEEPPVVGSKRTSLHGWKDGKWQFSAVALKEKGELTKEWRITTGNDLHDENAPRKSYAVDNYEQVKQAYNNGDWVPTRKIDEARRLVAEGANRPDINFLPPSELAQIFADRELATKYLGEQARYELEKRGLPIPESQRPDLINKRKIALIANDHEKLVHDKLKPLESKWRKKFAQYKKTQEQIDKDWTSLMYDSGIGELLQSGAYDTVPGLKAQVLIRQAQAKAHLATLPQAYRADLTAFAKEVKELHNSMYDYEAEHGRINKATAKEFKDRHELYIPLRGDERNSRLYRAIGNEPTPVDPLSRVVNEWNNAIRDVYENKELVAVYNLAKANNIKLPDGKPLFDLAPILNYKFDKYGELQGAADPLVMRQHTDSITAWIDGEPYRMAINEPSLRKALQRVPAGEMQLAISSTMRAMAMYNAFYGSLKTAFSPVFGVKNFIRDVSTAFAQADSRIGRAKIAKELVNPENWQQAMRRALNPYTKKQFKGEVKEQAGLISRRGLYGMEAERDNPTISLVPSLGRRVGEVRKSLLGFEEGKITGAFSAITKITEDVTRTALYNATMKSPKMWESVGKNNGTTGAAVEGALRKAVSGQPLTAAERTLVSHMQAEAADAAKTSTVNFEPKGRIAGPMNALYVFANARTQGLRTLTERLGLSRIRGGNTFAERLNRGNRITQASAGAAMLGGALLAMYGYKNDPENYGRLEDYQKDDYATGKSGGLSVPMPQELAFFWTLGQALIDGKMNTHRYPDESMRKWKAASRVGTRLLQTVWPGGTSLADPVGPKQGTLAKYLVRSVTPTIVQPGLDLAMNETTFGAPPVTGLHDGRPPKGPVYLHNADKVSPLARGLTETMHKGGVDIYPQSVQHYVNSILKTQVDLMHDAPEQMQFLNSIFGEPKKPATGGPRRSTLERTFFQEASPYTYKSDTENLLAYEKDKQDNQKTKSKKMQILEQGNTQAKNLYRGYQSKSEAEKEKINKHAEEVYRNTLKQYRQQF